MSLINKENPSINDWMPTPEQVKALFEFLKGGADKVVAEHPDGVSPILAVMCLDPMEDEAGPNIRVHFIAGGFTNKLDKKLQMKRIAAAVYKAKLVPIAAGLVSEAWCVMGEPKQEVDNLLDGHLFVSDHPKRVEIAGVSVLGFHGPSEHGLTMMDIRPLKRLSGTHEKGQVDFDGPWYIEQACQKEGKTHEPSNDSGSEANILEIFFYAFICFAMRKEDANHYLDGCVVEPVEIL